MKQRVAPDQMVYLVDDRPTDLLLIQRICENVGIPTTAYERASEFLVDVDTRQSGCLVADLLMPEMSGLDLFKQIQARGIPLTTILITGFADASSCRAGFQSGVFDFIEKDLSPGDLISIIQRALAHNRSEWVRRNLRADRMHRIEALTTREMDVAKLLSRGSALKEVGCRLNISVQTASKHRSNIFDKLEVSNEVELHQAFSDCMELLRQA